MRKVLPSLSERHTNDPDALPSEAWAVQDMRMVPSASLLPCGTWCTWNAPKPGMVHSRRVHVLPLSVERWTNILCPPTTIKSASTWWGRTTRPIPSASSRRSAGHICQPTDPAHRYDPSGMTSAKRSYLSRGFWPGQLYGIAGSSDSCHDSPSSRDSKTRNWDRLSTWKWSLNGEAGTPTACRPSGME